MSAQPTNNIGLVCPNENLKEAFLGFIKNSTTEFNVAATLTFSSPVYDRIEASRHLRHFTRRFNDELGFRNYLRKSRHDPTKRAAMIPVVEGDGQENMGGKRIHCHAALYCPDNMNMTDFIRLIRKCWSQTEKGLALGVDAVRIFDEDGWLEYITKEVTAINMDAIDFESKHIY